MKFLTRRLAALLASSLLAVPAQGESLTPDPTGLWFNAAEPGYGVWVAQQGETMFVVLFTHDAAQQPTWYVASSVRSTNGVLDPGGTIYEGTLYRATAPAFTAAFPPNAMVPATVGTVSLWQYSDFMNLTFRINGVSTTKIVRRQTWSSNRALALGSYAGNSVYSTSGHSPSCPADPGIPFASFSIARIEGERVRWTFGNGVVAQGMSGCEADGEWVQGGQLASFAGALRCGTTAATTTGTLTFRQIAANSNGLTTDVDVRLGTCAWYGRVSGAHTTF